MLFPGTAILTDSTTTTGTQTLTPDTGAGTDAVTYHIVSSITAGDSLTLTMASVVNPAGNGGGVTYDLTLGADNASTNTDTAGTQGLVTPQATFPHAGVTYPDGAIVTFGTTTDVFAGGAPFAATSDTLALVEQVDHASVQTAATGATAPTAAPHVGTLIVVTGFPTIYVVGTDGQLHAFATPKEFQSNGYDGAIVITVPDITGLTVGSDVGQVGAGANAAATSSDGAIVNSSGFYLVYAGGRAFGIPGPKVLTRILASEPAGTTPIAGTVASTATTASIANGTVLTIGGGVFVAYGQALYPFHGPVQLVTDGYAGSPSLNVPNFNGLSVASYAGS